MIIFYDYQLKPSILIRVLASFSFQVAGYVVINKILYKFFTPSVWGICDHLSGKATSGIKTPTVV